MSTESQKQRAVEIRSQFIDEFGDLPSSLRAPLNCVIEGTETEGSAQGILEFAEHALEVWRNQK